MIRVFTLSILLTSIGEPIAYAGSDPWQAARAGKIVCLVPDFPNKTCEVMTSIIWDADGTVKTVETTRVPVWPDLVVRAQTTVRLTGHKLCYSVTKDAYNILSIERGGLPISTTEFASIREQFTEINRPIFGGEFCAELKPIGIGDALIVLITLNGAKVENGEFPGVWLEPGTTYKLPNEP